MLGQVERVEQPRIGIKRWVTDVKYDIRLGWPALAEHVPGDDGVQVARLHSGLEEPGSIELRTRQ